MEKSLLRDGCVRLAAMDEVGRGALAGPVSVGVVVVTGGIGRVPAGLKDSKLLTPAAREALVPTIRRWAREFAVGHASAEEIDAIGIIAALRLAARRALSALAGPVDAVLLDGNYDYLTEPDPALFDEPEPVLPASGDETGELRVRRLPVLPAERAAGLAAVPPLVRTRIKADLTCAGVAGASVLAKTERDAFMCQVADRHEPYGFAVNKGYGTPEHITALRRHGPSVLHRRSWRLPLAGGAVSGTAALELGMLDDDGVPDPDGPPVEPRLRGAEDAEHDPDPASGDRPAAVPGVDVPHAAGGER
ncbi:ribonuclease HII [Nakamurella endophytica]|uniref:ribonuclease HII n=1 Tax=Nakamurella endophytica TaxID=1748367 RepID=UPI001E4437FE|nr:ribonuclease HII [Nakamurella endophytica]